MIRSAQMLSIFLLIVLCGACAIKPLPQDFSGYNTYKIVQRIRCEVRDEVRSHVFNYIRKYKDGKYEELAKDLYYGRKDFAAVNRSSLDKEVQVILNRYDGADVTYDFTFDITENNVTNPTLSLVRPFSKVVNAGVLSGLDKLGLSAASDLKRQNTRTLRVHDRFYYLLTKAFPDRFCLDKAQSEDGIYPITGKIGVEDQVYTFLSLNQSGNLGSQKDTGTAPALIDNIKFTTKLSAGLNPSFQLTPIGSALRVADAGLKLDYSREDIHQVIIVLSLPLSGIDREDSLSPNTIAERRLREDSLVERARQIELIGVLGNLRPLN